MKKLISFLILAMMATSIAACTAETETDDDNDLLDGILADPDADELVEDTTDEEEPYIEPPTYLPGDAE